MSKKLGRSGEGVGSSHPSLCSLYFALVPVSFPSRKFLKTPATRAGFLGFRKFLFIFITTAAYLAAVEHFRYILTTSCHIHILVYFQHHRRLNRVFDLSALKRHLALLDCINTASQSIIKARAIFATYLSVAFEIDVPSNTGMIVFFTIFL